MRVPKVTLIDYGIGNLWSVASAIKYLGAQVDLISDPEKISRSSTLVLPGLGSFRKGMEALIESGIDKAILSAVKDNDAKILGICMGMQLMGSYGTEDGGSMGLGLISNRVERFDQEEIHGNKIPHVGFNDVHFSDRNGLFKDFPKSSDFYFTHSYRMLIDGIRGRYATCDYGEEFLAAFQVNKICGVQFHPEKSQTNGLLLLRNFLQD
jgi:imidazole glycerol-phosphate synthase subunit HisH